MQNKVNDFNKKIQKSSSMPTYARLLDIQSEMGELAKEYLKATDYGNKDFNLTLDFKMEFGDVLYSLLSLANELSLNSEECLNLILEKYKKRFIDKNNIGSSN